MTIRDARLKKCAACERTFDVNFPSRMQRYQKLHEAEQLHFWPCDFLERRYYALGVTRGLYDTPWEDKPKLKFFHSDECEESYIHPGDFNFIDCEGCGRTICEQNPANGWHVQFRDHADLGYVCLKCYEAEILENGQPRSDFETSKIGGGMFLSWNNTEARDAGFEDVDGFRNYFASGREHARQFNQKALELIDSGYNVITAYERLAIGGLEGSITMMARPKAAGSA